MPANVSTPLPPRPNPSYLSIKRFSGVSLDIHASPIDIIFIVSGNIGSKRRTGRAAGRSLQGWMAGTEQHGRDATGLWGSNNLLNVKIVGTAAAVGEMRRLLRTLLLKARGVPEPAMAF